LDGDSHDESDPQPGPVVTTYTDHVPDPPHAFEQDKETGVFCLRWPDGEVEVFPDKPVRYLVIEPDAETGELKPVLKRGKPTYLCLCREEHEVR
jgi:hypothetical protein